MGTPIFGGARSSECPPIFGFTHIQQGLSLADWDKLPGTWAPRAFIKYLTIIWR